MEKHDKRMQKLGRSGYIVSRVITKGRSKLCFSLTAYECWPGETANGRHILV